MPARRPCRSVNAASSAPPSGRKKNPTAKIANALSSAVAPLPPAKNCLEK